jgi:hypothetical protein
MLVRKPEADRAAVQVPREARLGALRERETPRAVQPVALREVPVAQEPAAVAVRAAPEEQVAPNSAQPARRFLFWRRRSTCANDRQLRLRWPSDRLIAAILVGIVVAGITFSVLAFLSSR